MIGGGRKGIMGKFEPFLSLTTFEFSVRQFLMSNSLPSMLNKTFYGDNIMKCIEIPSIYMKYKLFKKFQICF